MIEKVEVHKGGSDAAAELLKEKILSCGEMYTGKGKTYYVSERGDDLNDGLSAESPFRNYLRVEDIELNPGDSVLFERGSVFRVPRMMRIKSGVYYGAYGSGEKPAIYGSLRNYAAPDIWQKTSDFNIWCTELATEMRAGVTTFDSDSCLGEWKYTKSELHKDGDFYHDRDNGKYYLYFESGNPGEYYDDIEISTTELVMRGSFVENVHIDNLCFKYNTFGPFLFDDVKDISITNCVMGWHGGKIFEIRQQGPIRYGNAVEFWHRCENILIKNCWVYQVFDAAMTFQGFGDNQARFENIRFEENLIEYCSMNIEYWAGRKEDEEPPHIKNILYKGNIIRFGGYGWGGIFRIDKEDQALLLGWNNLYDDLENFVITDNILDCADCYMIYMRTPEEQKGFSVHNNTYYQKKPSGSHEFTEIIKGKATLSNNQQEFEKAISLFDKSPKTFKWIE